jgi:hypothetical protein
LSFTPLPDTRPIQFVFDALLVPTRGLGTGHGALRNEMLLKDVLDFCPDLRPFVSGKLSDSFDDPTCHPDIESAALFHAELGGVSGHDLSRHWLLLERKLWLFLRYSANTVATQHGR